MYLNYLFEKRSMLKRKDFSQNIGSRKNILIRRCLYFALTVFMMFLVLDVGAQQMKPCIKLGAYYFGGWSGRSRYDDGTPEHAWAKGMPTHISKKLTTQFAGRTPIWGWRDDAPGVMEQQIDLAADNGISFFAFDWYWHDNKGPINIQAIQRDPKHHAMYQFMKAKDNNKMEFCLLVANHTGSEIIGEDAWRQAADYWITLFKHPRYLRVDGRPLIIIFSPGEGNVAGLDYLQKAAREAGFPGVAVAGCGDAGKPEYGYDLKTDYGIHGGYGRPSEKHDFHEIIDECLKRWNESGSQEQPYIPLLTVGWDRRPWEAPDGLGKGAVSSWYFTGRSPKLLGSFMEKLVQWMDGHPKQITKDRLALLCAWNEMGEGSWLVPCKDDPHGAYLKAIKQVVFGE
jgi:hypothetical protein